MIEHGYTVHDSEASEVELGDFLYGLVRYSKPRLIVETGCYLGHTTARLGEACRDNETGEVVSFDINQAYISTATVRCLGLPVRIYKLKENEMGVIDLARADMVFSDSASQKMRMAEFEICNAGCIFVVHDTWGHGAEHNRTLSDWVKSKGGQVFPFGRGIGVILK